MCPFLAPAAPVQHVTEQARFSGCSAAATAWLIPVDTRAPPSSRLWATSKSSASDDLGGRMMGLAGAGGERFARRLDGQTSA
jgi:hypothetical protein